ncbi:hypothetical protein ACIQW5_28520 [Methylorubrum thiocyanatum]|uniref:hypothetical protein n=1 Tax=Methylorubrum thiocyanatum TaxID=47958 RepID=UPI00383BC980
MQRDDALDLWVNILVPEPLQEKPKGSFVIGLRPGRNLGSFHILLMELVEWRRGLIGNAPEAPSLRYVLRLVDPAELTLPPGLPSF